MEVESKVKKNPRVVVGVLIVNGGEILLARAKKWADKWAVIGGHIEWGETMIDAVKRESKEETGLDVFDVEFLKAQENIFPKDYYEERHFIMLDFICNSKSRDVFLNEELQEFKWIKAEDALKLTLQDNTRIFVENYMKSKSKN